jgi:cytochrome c553
MRHLGACLLLLLSWLLAPVPARAVDYLRDVKPILRQHCYNCHGALRQNGGLRLDHISFIREGGDRGTALAATGKESLLVRALQAGEDSSRGDMERMPREAKPLSDEQVATLAAWIDAGAPTPDEPLPTDPRQHWSFQKPVRPPLPPAGAEHPDWASHPIDRFLAAEHAAHGLTPAAPAAKNVLLRRVYLDLIGLPPTTADLREFLADPSREAYERVVDKLLASPQYGERWGRHWMDVWRYSDWDGFGAEVRESKPHIWRWRDWIIESLNADQPYDQMVRDMLAADELAPLDANAARAEGFLARNWFRFNRNVWLEQTVEHTSKAFLGITLNCARCHDHMYDPILQREYYQFRAVFEPHDVRTDRVAGQSDTARDGLLRIFDTDATRPTFLFVRGNEGKPDKEHPLAPAVPQALGGDDVKFDPVALPPTAYYPGLQTFVRQETLAQVETELGRSEPAMAKAVTTLAEARKKLADFSAAKTAAVAAKDAAPAATQPTAETAPPAKTDAPAKTETPEATEATLTAAITAAEGAAALAEQTLLAASSNLAAVRAKLAADDASFAAPPAANAAELAREANRAQRVGDVQQAKREVLRLEQELAAARAATDEANKKKVAQLEPKLATAHKARDAAQTALGQASENYKHFTEVYPATSSGRRAALARWIASKNNPLTARVAINHIWLRHFGAPLVPTVFDFGLNGKPPTHPALLDWLAVELMDGGWRMKSIHRLLVTSTAYQVQSTGERAENRARDPENAYLWRMNPRRMEAEVVRDSTLRVSGSLDATMFGPELDQGQGLVVPRRSIYFRSSKEKKVTFLEMFDSPNVTDCYRRSETVAPQQALAMVNSSLTLAEARRLAGALTTELGLSASHDDPPAFIGAAFERILCRPPSGEELATCREFLETQSRRFADPKLLVAFTSGGENPVKPSADPLGRARENLVHVLLNHNDFLTVR